MKENGFDEKDIRQLFIINPSRAFGVSIRKK
jgi:predicted metal-dependent phosphotriesterase family hydrolase